MTPTPEEEPGVVRPRADGPKTFTELLGDSPAAGDACRHCGEPATMRFQVTVRPIPPEGSGRAGAPSAIAEHRQTLCEEHAVRLFVAFKRALR